MSTLERMFAEAAEKADRDNLLARMRAADRERAQNTSKDVFGKTYAEQARAPYSDGRGNRGEANEAAADWLISQRRYDKAPGWFFG